MSLPHRGGSEASFSGIRLRRAESGDAQAIGAVFDASVRTGWAYLGELVRRPMFSGEDWEKFVADHAPPNVLLVAADESDRVVGYTAVHSEDGELFRLFVAPHYSGRGIGRMLLSAAHEALRSAGCREAFLFTEERNERALDVYARAGYRTDGTIRESDFRGTAIRELRLVKLL